MTHSRLILGALAVAAAIGIATPASAIPATWSGPYSLHVNALDFTVGTGTLRPGLPKTHLDLLGSSVGVDRSIAFAGPVSVTINTIPATTPQDLIVWCDDLVHHFQQNHTYNNYFASDPTAPIDVVNYIDLGTTTAHDIMGLAALGTNDYIIGTLTPELGAAIQLAIWELEYGGTATFSGDAGFQSLVANLMAGAAADYTLFTSQPEPWTFSQLEAPCNQNLVGIMTQFTRCQTQGQIVAIPGTIVTGFVPEPITLSLFGAGLAGIAAYRRRRRNA
jgi:PEP-CTERM motif